MLKASRWRLGRMCLGIYWTSLGNFICTPDMDLTNTVNKGLLFVLAAEFYPIEMIAVQQAGIESAGATYTHPVNEKTDCMNGSLFRQVDFVVRCLFLFPFIELTPLNWLKVPSLYCKACIRIYSSFQKLPPQRDSPCVCAQSDLRLNYCWLSDVFQQFLRTLEVSSCFLSAQPVKQMRGGN